MPLEGSDRRNGTSEEPVTGATQGFRSQERNRVTSSHLERVTQVGDEVEACGGSGGRSAEAAVQQVAVSGCGGGLNTGYGRAKHFQGGLSGATLLEPRSPKRFVPYDKM